MKKFRELLINGIYEDIHGSTIERLVKVKQCFESESFTRKNFKDVPI